jgi:hypothetical protein
MSDSDERIDVLRNEFRAQLNKARQEFDRDKPSLAAAAAENAARIATKLSDLNRELGNLCADFRLLEWQPDKGK